MSSEGFIFDWTKQLGFRNNPFEEDLKKRGVDFYSGYEKDRIKLNLFILENYPFGIIKGESGFGKTLTLRWIESQLKGHRGKVKVAFINAKNLDKERDLIEGIVLPLLNAYEKTFQKVHKKIQLKEVGKFLYTKLKDGQRLVIIIDDVGGLPKTYLSLFMYFFKNKLPVQLIVAGTASEVTLSGISSVSEKDWLNIHLSGLSFSESEEFLKKRIAYFGQDDIFPFQEAMLKRIYEQSEKNPRLFLKSCREKAIKLALDRKYIEREIHKIEEKMQKEEKRDERSGEVISIKFGSKKDKFDKGFGAPDGAEQEDMLAELIAEDKHDAKKNHSHVSHKDHEAEYLEEKKKHVLDDDIPKPDDKIVIPVDDEKKKLSRKDRKEADRTEKLLSDLAQEFEK